MNSHLTRDLRVAARSFLRTPRFTIPALLALALGIGSTSAIFSVVRGVMLTPLPVNKRKPKFHEPDEHRAEHEEDPKDHGENGGGRSSGSNPPMPSA